MSVARGRRVHGHRVRADLAALERTPAWRALDFGGRDERERAERARAEDRRPLKDNQTVDHSGSEERARDTRAPLYEQRTHAGVAQGIERDAQRRRVDDADAAVSYTHLRAH